MFRFNYRVITYYSHIDDSTECYGLIINAKNKTELDDYLSSSDMDYIIISAEKMDSIDVLDKATSILIDGCNCYKGTTDYNGAYNLITSIYNI